MGRQAMPEGGGGSAGANAVFLGDRESAELVRETPGPDMPGAMKERIAIPARFTMIARIALERSYGGAGNVPSN